MDKQIAKIRAPKGFYFHIQPFYRGRYNSWGYESKSGKKVLSNVSVQLRDSKTHRAIGTVTLERYYDGKRWLETHSNLDSAFHGKGYGVKLYARAIQWALENGYKIRSSGASSAMAQRVWRGNRIREKFTIRAKRAYYTPYGSNKKISDPNSETWFAYPK
jgi:GNAT superfamily N-acetyltransferase